MGGRRRSRRGADERQLAMHAWFEVPRPPAPRPAALAGLDQALRQALSRQLKDSPQSRYEVAARMSELLGDEISKNMLDAYTAESRETHQISAVRLVALVLATDGHELLDLLAEHCGCRLLIGDEVRLAQRGWAQQQLKRFQRLVRELDDAEPVELRRRA